MEKGLKLDVVKLSIIFLFLGFMLTFTTGDAVAFYVSKNSNSWIEANNTCTALNGTLPNTDESLKVLKRQLEKTKSHEYWIGLVKGDENGEFKWIINSIPFTPIIQNVDIDEKEKKDRHCVVFKKKKNSDKYELKAKKCKNKKKFVCQGVKVSPTNETTREKHNQRMIEEYHLRISELDPADPDSMKDMFEIYDDLMLDIDFNLPDFNLLLAVNAIEQFALKYAKMHLNSSNSKEKIESEEIVCHAEIVQGGRNSSVSVSIDTEDSITLPVDLFKESEVIVVMLVFKNPINASQATKIFEGKPNAARLNTRIISLNTDPQLKVPFQENIQITFQHIQANITSDPSDTRCSFWNYSIPTSINGSWSDRGCHVKSSNGRQTVCECNHMTNFAVLMQLKPEKLPEEHRIALTTITYVGLILSLLGEAITVLCYYLFLNLHEKIQIRINLLCTLGTAQIVMMAGIAQTQSKGACVFVASLIHYFYLVSFCWMLMEGVYLYRMVVKVFDAGLKMRVAYFFSYGFPVPFVLLALFLAEFVKGGIFFYTNKYYCWVNFQNHLIWSFVAPVLIIITINSVLLFSVIKEMFSMKTIKTVSSIELSMIRASIRACVVLLPLLGITWMFGLLSLANIGIAWQYIFTILNATQGFIIFIFHCLRNTELRTAISLKLHQWESNNSSHHSKGRITPTKLNKETKSSDESPRNSVPMVAPITNKVMPKNTI